MVLLVRLSGSDLRCLVVYNTTRTVDTIGCTWASCAAQVGNLLAKLGLRTRAEAAAYAARRKPAAEQRNSRIHPRQNRVILSDRVRDLVGSVPPEA
ncbi:hypothetical protein PA7_05460 [Pseudonocardia asaccharolytica DSM 44247 = NBRC 16224]|uniref:Uncharacterized protein n=1 Tax=Pseudonocardia asaccharolytica DSM 44247 = NBRC 16224 TaxID=1123024 RepID=A0A511CVV6_9PSEU|nr:hypothetical protein PA7_05460 [Pseudonocardia asaccharolytica DSM 44247 = NBRC 16224]